MACGRLDIVAQRQQHALPRHLPQRHRFDAHQHLVFGPRKQHGQQRRIGRNLQGRHRARERRGQRHFRLALQVRFDIGVEDIEFGHQLGERVAHLDGLGAKLGAVARRDETLAPVVHRLPVAARPGIHQAPGDGRLPLRHHFVQVAQDPGARGGGIVDRAIFQRRFQALRIAVGADGQSGAGKLQQVEQCGRLHQASGCRVICTGNCSVFCIVTSKTVIPAQAGIHAELKRTRSMDPRRMVVVVVTVAAAIRAGLRLEPGLFFDDHRPQPRQHFLEHRIGADAQKAVAHLRLRVAVTQMESAAQQRVRIEARHLVGGLGRGHHGNHAPVFARQQVAAPQHGAARGEHGHVLARIERGAQAAFFAQFVGQHQARSDGGGTGIGRRDFRMKSLHIVLEQEVALRHRQHAGCFAHQQFAIGAHFIGFGVDVHLRRQAIVDHVGLAQGAHVFRHDQRLVQFELRADVVVICRLRHERERLFQAAAKGAEHHPVVHRLRRGDRCIRIAHGRGRDHAALDDGGRLDAEEGRLPQHQVGDLAHFDGTHRVRNAVRDGRIDRVLGDIALDAEVVVGRRILRQRSALHLHLVRGLPGAQHHLAHPAHGLRIGRHHRDGADVVQDVLGGDSFAADARFGKRHVFDNRRIEVVAHHQHVQVFVERIDGERPGGVGGRRQHIGFADRGDDVGRMAAARAFGVEGVDGAVLEGGNGVRQVAAFVEGVAVDRHLHVHLVGHRQAVVDGRWRAAPVLVQFEADGAGAHLLLQRPWQAHVALAEEAEVHRERIGRLQHRVQVPWSGGAGGGRRAGRRPRAAADHGGHAAHQRFLDLLRADEVDVGIDAAGGDDLAFAGDDLGGGGDDHRHAGLDVRVAGLADGGDHAVADADVGLDDAPVVDDDGVGDHGVHHQRVGAAALRLAHAVADHLAAAEFDFLAVDGVIVFDFDKQFGVRQPDAVTLGGTEHLRVGAARDCSHVSLCQRLIFWRIGIELAHDFAAEAEDFQVAGHHYQFDRALLARFEPHGGAGSDVEALAVGLPALELELRVHFKKMEVGANLHRAVALVGHHHRDGYGVMNRNELAAVGESGFHLDVRDHFGDAVHDVLARQDGLPFGHQLRHGLAVARTFHDGARDQRHRLGIIEFQPARQAPFGHDAGGENEQLVFFSWSQFHGMSSSCLPDARRDRVARQQVRTQAAPHVQHQPARRFAVVAQVARHQHALGVGDAEVVIAAMGGITGGVGADVGQQLVQLRSGQRLAGRDQRRAHGAAIERQRAGQPSAQHGALLPPQQLALAADAAALRDRAGVEDFARAAPPHAQDLAADVGGAGCQLHVVVERDVGRVEKNGFLRQPFERRVFVHVQVHGLARALAVGLVPLGGAGRGDARVPVVAHADVDGQLVAAHYPARRMDDDGVAYLAVFRVQRFLHPQRAVVAVVVQARGAVIVREAEREGGLPRAGIGGGMVVEVPRGGAPWTTDSRLARTTAVQAHQNAPLLRLQQKCFAPRRLGAQRRRVHTGRFPTLPGAQHENIHHRRSRFYRRLDRGRTGQSGPRSGGPGPPPGPGGGSGQDRRHRHRRHAGRPRPAGGRGPRGGRRDQCGQQRQPRGRGSDHRRSGRIGQAVPAHERLEHRGRRVRRSWYRQHLLRRPAAGTDCRQGRARGHRQAGAGRRRPGRPFGSAVQYADLRPRRAAARQRAAATPAQAGAKKRHRAPRRSGTEHLVQCAHRRRGGPVPAGAGKNCAGHVLFRGKRRSVVPRHERSNGQGTEPGPGAGLAAGASERGMGLRDGVVRPGLEQPRARTTGPHATGLAAAPSVGAGVDRRGNVAGPRGSPRYLTGSRALIAPSSAAMPDFWPGGTTGPVPEWTSLHCNAKQTGHIATGRMRAPPVRARSARQCPAPAPTALPSIRGCKTGAPGGCRSTPRHRETGPTVRRTCRTRRQYRLPRQHGTRQTSRERRQRCSRPRTTPSTD
uniref:Uncharacterized protein n=1 Tax=Tanacetum cinerariifolium TaxID=118510 RepID=A0A699GE49_TANCI|nr:hypothetical protein [Tanacetum cinerariifolium]